MHEGRERAAEMERLKKNFLHTMSHELRTPMSGLIGFGDELRGYEKDPTVRKMGELIYSGARRLTNTLNHI